MYDMLNRVEFLDKLNANTQKRLESGRKTQILSDIDRLKAAAHGAGGDEKRRLEEGIAQLNSDLAKMRGVSVGSQTDARPQAIPKGFPKAKAKSKASAKAKAMAFNPILGRMERVHEEYLREPRGSGTEYFEMSPRPKAKAEPKAALRRLRPIGQSTLDAFARQ
jgi:hypothetical protein